MMRFAMIAGLATGAAGVQCSAGYKLKKTLTGLTCDTADASSAKDCNTNCCEADTKTCGGLTPTCASGYYTVAAKATQKEKDAYASIAADTKTMNSACCTRKATCGSGAFTCPAGQMLDTGKLGNDCTDDAASCPATCCKADPSTCGGSGNTPAGSCGSFSAPDATQDTWKATKIINSNFASSCCGVKSVCGSKLYQCPAGKKRKTGDAVKHLKCGGIHPSTCATSSNCCETDDTVCAGITGYTCTVGRYQDSGLDTQKVPGKDLNERKANAPEACCSPKATCDAYTCPVGGKKKANIGAALCNKDATKASCETTCCEADAATCGGQKVKSGLSCAVGFYDESSTWTSKTTQATKDAWSAKKTTDATKDKDCCTAKAECSAGVAGVTTTPAATVTPAAAVRLFREHKAAVQASSSNLVWLAAGSFIGMTVMFVAQRLRSGRRSYTSMQGMLEADEE